MKILSSELNLYSQSKSVQEKSVKESFKTKTLIQPAIGQKKQIKSSDCKKCKDSDEASLSPKQKLIKDILEKMWGIKVRVPNKQKQDGKSEDSYIPSNSTTQWEYKREELFKKEQFVEFSSKGNVVTEDGVKIDFSIEFILQSKFEQYSSFSANSKNMKDPLTFHFKGVSSELSNFQFQLDMDLDGTKEALPFAPSGAGFLFLDRDENGQVTDGSELFGAKTGNGFKELAEFDSDNNGWIDENDPVFFKLQVWEKDKSGNDVFYSLKDKGVGAIALQSVKTPFDLGNPMDSSGGKIQRTGVFLKEDGTPGIVQQIDLFG